MEILFLRLSKNPLFYLNKVALFFFFVDADDDAIEVAKSIALRQIDKFRITTIDRVKGDLSTAFMVYDKEDGKLKFGKSQFFEK